MALSRPFRNVDELLGRAAAIWNDLPTTDWLEAFAAHPKIGGTKTSTPQAAQWSSGEQAGMETSGDAVKRDLAAANDEYYKKFGYIYIVCATGKSGDEMLELCRARLGNDPSTEIEIAAAEQQKITDIRLRKLLSS